MHNNRSLPAVAIMFLDQEKNDPDYALKLGLHNYREIDILLISKKMTKQINACCKDLLEVNIIKWEDSFLQYKVDFLHRTVRDFLVTKEMVHLVKTRSAAEFDPHVSLCRILLAQIKTYPLTTVK